MQNLFFLFSIISKSFKIRYLLLFSFNQRDEYAIWLLSVNYLACIEKNLLDVSFILR